MFNKIYKAGKEFFGQYFAHKATDKVADTLLDSAGEKIINSSVETVKAKFMGIGSTDEMLTLSAFKIAYIDFCVPIEDLMKVLRVFQSCSNEQLNKITNIIGYGNDETEIDNSKEYGTGKFKKVHKNVQKRAVNQRGAEMIFFLSQMTEDEIRLTLDGVSATRTTSDAIKEIYEKSVDATAKVHDTIVDMFPNKVADFDQNADKKINDLRTKLNQKLQARKNR